MLSKKVTLITGALLLTCFQAYPAIHTVSKSADDGGQYRTINDAVGASQDGDEVVIKDFAVYEERVVITKTNFTLRSENPSLSKKPTIKWLDTKNVGPKNADESKIDSLITYLKNGTLFIHKSQNIIISGLTIDGGGLTPFAYPAIWNAKDPLSFGNCGVNMLQSGNVAIRYCDIRNAFYGVYVNDQNPGGAYTPNINVLTNQSLAPLSAFGKAGNHIIEYSKIHNNSFGLLFESSWDLGSTVRYNLIYENHHPDSMYAKIKAMPDGGNQPGGAFMFKDNLFSPLAIYNNTFWHNSLIFAAHWKAGHQHLVFNNIFAEPYKYWSQIRDMVDWMEISPKLTNRMHNCLFAAQKQAPEYRSQVYEASMVTPDSIKITGKDTIRAVQGIQLMNGMTKWEIEGDTVPIPLLLPSGDTEVVLLKADWVIKPGALSLDFPKEANIRWVETKFKSIDTLSPDFLIPDLSDSITKACVVNVGWKDAGIADIGAPVSSVRGSNIIPVDPAYITDNKIVLHFKLDVPEDILPKLKLKYLRLVKGLVNDPDAFGAVAKLVIPQSNIVSLGSISINGATNLVELPIPASDPSDQYGFVEMIFSDGTGTTVAGFIPYRKSSPPLNVQLLDLQTNTPVNRIIQGNKLLLKVTYESTDTPVFDSADIRLLSGEKIYSTDGKEFTVTKNFLTTLTDTIVFNHSGNDALVIRTYGTLNLQKTYPIGNTLILTIIPPSAILPKSAIKFNNPKNSHYILFSLNGKKIGTFTMDQLVKLKSANNRQIPSGMYCAFTESAVDKKIVRGSQFKVIVP